MSVVKTQVTICPYMNFGEGIVLTKIHYRPVAKISQRRRQKPQGGPIFLNTILDVCSNWGGTDFK